MDDVILPHGRGRAIKVCVIGGSELVQKAKGIADQVLTADELGKIADNKKEAKKMAAQFDFFIAEASLMPVVGKRLGIVLAPRGKMPRPIQPGADPKPMIENLRKTVTVRSKDHKTFHAAVGTAAMTPEQIADNIDMILKRLTTKLERGTMNIGSVFVKTTMGPAERIM